jgi:hypothetical protein
MKFFYSFVLMVASAILSACGGGGGSPGTNPNALISTTSSTVQTATLTFTSSPSTAASIAIAAGDKIDNSDPIFYEQRFAATVATTAGLPVVGAKVALSVTYPGFYKGRLYRDPVTFEVTSFDEFFCPGEDIANNNDVLDPGEDVNLNGILEPRKASVTATFEGGDITDSNGNVKILVRYSKANANWILYRLNTSVTVTGTEGKAGFNLQTSFAAGDEKVVSTPFVFSPFGQNNNCSSAL